MEKLWKTLVAFVALASMAVAAAEPSIGRGKELFESTKLGTSGKSCAGCHPGGKKLERAATYDEGELGGIINQCIMKPLNGTALDPASTEMKSLIMYIRTFANPGKQ